MKSQTLPRRTRLMRNTSPVPRRSQNWFRSRNGNLYTWLKDGRRLTVFRRANGDTCYVTTRKSGRPRYVGPFNNELEAAQAVSETYRDESLWVSGWAEMPD